MSNLKNNNMSEARVLKLSDGQSRTVRKFTTRFGKESIPHSVSVTLDWLQFSIGILLPEPPPEQTVFIMEKDIVLELKPMGTGTYKYGYTVFQHAEPVANLFTHGRNDKIIKPGTGKLEILNHVLYSTWSNVISDLVLVLRLESVIITRLDIAIDGANYMHQFLNAYTFQEKKRGFAALRTLGKYDQAGRVKMLGKARFDELLLNRKTGMFDTFHIGSSKKAIKVYNKSREIEQKSGKNYIKDAWRRAGMNAADTVYRVELQLKNDAIKTIVDLRIERLSDPNYLLSIFKTQTKKFFEFVKMKDSNVTRGTIIDLFQFEKLKTPLLEKIPRAIVRGAYKARLAIHGAFAAVRTGKINTEEKIHAALQHISDLTDLFNLREWYERKKPDWLELYPQPVRFYEGDKTFYI